VVGWPPLIDLGRNHLPPLAGENEAWQPWLASRYLISTQSFSVHNNLTKMTHNIRALVSPIMLFIAKYMNPFSCSFT
jgi:hypothetical protein